MGEKIDILKTKKENLFNTFLTPESHINILVTKGPFYETGESPISTLIIELIESSKRK
jgi:hypothetical protein